MGNLESQTQSGGSTSRSLIRRAAANDPVAWQRLSQVLRATGVSMVPALRLAARGCGRRGAGGVSLAGTQPEHFSPRSAGRLVSRVALDDHPQQAARSSSPRPAPAAGHRRIDGTPGASATAGRGPRRFGRSPPPAGPQRAGPAGLGADATGFRGADLAGLLEDRRRAEDRPTGRRRSWARRWRPSTWPNPASCAACGKNWTAWT